MDTSKLRLGEAIAAASAVALFVVMFFGWYGIEVPKGVQGEASRGLTEVTASAWEAFDFLDAVLLLVLVVALAPAVLSVVRRTPALPVAASVFTAALGIIATLLVALRILDQPGPNELVGVELGAFLGLLAAAGIAAGGWLSLRDEGAAVGDPVEAHVPTRPAPPAEAAHPPPAP